MIAAFNLWMEVPPNDLAIIGDIVSMLHNASLLYVLLLFLYIFTLKLLVSVLMTLRITPSSDAVVQVRHERLNAYQTDRTLT